MPAPVPLVLSPDRLLPADPGIRSVARRLYEAVADLPILSPHGHVDARLLADDVPFRDPASLLVTPDHYVTRLLHAAGVPLAALAADPGFSGRVLPTFRPDRYLEVAAPGWADAVGRLGSVSGVDTGSYAGWVAAMENRREHFRAHGAVSADHSHEDVGTQPLDDPEGAYRRALAGTVDPSDAVALRRHMLLEMARMSCDDGLVMTLHPGVRRNHHQPTFDAYGTDVGADIPLRVEFTDALRPLLNRYGTHPSFQLVLFTLDETTFSTEIGPLAGFYPSVFAGAPWWFLDAPDAIRRYRAAITESAGFAKTSGFIDDTRAFCSIPARHDMSRRLDAGYLAQLVAEHRLDEDEALATATDLVATNPRKAFRL